MPSLTLVKKPRTKERAQAIVEFAIALPILMVMLVGIIEVGRLIYAYAAVINASREAARYASAVGYADGTTYKKFQYCAGIREVARKAAFPVSITDSEISITYDHGDLGSTFETCDGTVDTGIAINGGSNYDRATVTINTTFRPAIKLIPIRPQPIESRSSRTILGIYELPEIVGVGGGGGGGSGGGGGGGGGSSTATPTATATATNTPTDTPTPKNPTHTPRVATLTPMNTATSMPTSTATATATATATLQSTPTFTPTFTATYTPDPCSLINADAITIDKKTMYTTIRSTSAYVFTISSVEVNWNQSTGASGNKALALIKAEYGTTSLWSGTDGTGTRLIPLSPTITVPAGGNSSAFTFTFDANYDFPAGLTSIKFNVSSPSCGSFSITRTK